MASEAVLRRLERIGQGMITAEQGLSSLERILCLDQLAYSPVVAVNKFEWSKYLTDASPSMFSEFKVQGAAEAKSSKSMSKPGSSKRHKGPNVSRIRIGLCPCRCLTSRWC